MGIILLIIVGVVGYVVIKGVMKANARMAYADQQAAMREVRDHPEMAARMPSWTADKDRLEQFIYAQMKWAETSGLSVSYAAHVFTDPESVDELMGYLAALERRGTSFVGQGVAAGEWITKRFIVLPMAQKTPFLEMDVQAMVARAAS